MHTASLRQIIQYIKYEMHTGRLFWAKNPGKTYPAGSEAGTTAINGYRYVQFRGKKILAHRLIWFLMTGKLPEAEIDHINGVRDDNRWENLRKVFRAENAKNLVCRKDNKSKCLGVVWHKSNRKWCARITVNGNRRVLGYSYSLLDAAALRKSAENFYGFHPNHGRQK